MSTPLSYGKLDLNRYRRMKQRVALNNASAAAAAASSTPPAASVKATTTTPSSSTPNKQVMTWDELEATLTPQERQSFSRTTTTTTPRRHSTPAAATTTTPNENRPPPLKEDIQTSSTRRQRRLAQKQHLLGSRGGRSTPKASSTTGSSSGDATTPFLSRAKSEPLTILKTPPTTTMTDDSPTTKSDSPSAASAFTSSAKIVVSNDSSSPNTTHSVAAVSRPSVHKRYQALSSAKRKKRLFAGSSTTPTSGRSLMTTKKKLENNESHTCPHGSSDDTEKDRTSNTSSPTASSNSAPTDNDDDESYTPVVAVINTPPLSPVTSPALATTTTSKRHTTPMSSSSSTRRRRSFSLERRRTATQERARQSATRLYARAATTPSPEPLEAITPTFSDDSSSKMTVPPEVKHDAEQTSSTPAASDSKPHADTPSSTESRRQRGERRASSMEKAKRAMRRSLSADRKGASPSTTTTGDIQKTESSDSHTSTSIRSAAAARTISRKSVSPPSEAGTGGTRRNLDKRTARLLHANEFSSDIARYRQKLGLPRPVHPENADLHGRGRFVSQHGGVSVFVRKRPIFHYELERGEFDVVFTEAREDCDAVVVHTCNLHSDMRQLLVKPVSFPCSAAFDEDCSNQDLYVHVGKPMVHLVAQGGMCTLLMLGQTGSGKTHTMTGMEELMTKDLFHVLSGKEQVQVTVQFVELCGKQCSDLVEQGDVRVAEKEDGSVVLLDAARREVSSPEELSQVIQECKRRRATEATARNGVSSRSHAVCQITVEHKDGGSVKRGVLTLLDCAGTERRNDSLYHNHDRQKESAEINASLWALKECIRARAVGKQERSHHVPYRSSNLTRILRETLEREDALLCVIATVAPNATDTEHTLETLRLMATLVGLEGGLEESKPHAVLTSPRQHKSVDSLTPKQWNHDQLVDFMSRKRLLDKRVPEHFDGKLIMRLSRIQLKNILYDKDNAGKADALFHALRAENDRVARQQIKRRIALSKQGRPTGKLYEI